MSAVRIVGIIAVVSLLLFFGGHRLHAPVAPLVLTVNHPIAEVPPEIRSPYIGEKIIYDVKLGVMKVGSAVYEHFENADFNGTRVNHVSFETTLANFHDREEIYSDLKSFLPLRVARTIKSWTMNEEITEDYDQQKFVLSIEKLSSGKQQDLVISKQSPIHNAIILPFYLRQIPDLKVGWKFRAQLPTKDFEITLVGIETLKLSSGVFEVYRFNSVPAQFEICVTTDKRRIPVKIKGTGMLGYTLLLKEYSSPEKEL